MKSTADILREARKLIERPEAWTQGVWARNAAGAEVEESSSDAVCWCSVGAIFRVAPRQNYDVIRALAALTGGMSPIAFNDTHTHAEVLAALDKAIALAESSQ